MRIGGDASPRRGHVLGERQAKDVRLFERRAVRAHRTCASDVLHGNDGLGGELDELLVAHVHVGAREEASALAYDLEFPPVDRLLVVALRDLAGSDRRRVNDLEGMRGVNAFARRCARSCCRGSDDHQRNCTNEVHARTSTGVGGTLPELHGSPGLFDSQKMGALGTAFLLLVAIPRALASMAIVASMGASARGGADELRAWYRRKLPRTLRATRSMRRRATCFASCVLLLVGCSGGSETGSGENGRGEGSETSSSSGSSSDTASGGSSSGSSSGTSGASSGDPASKATGCHLTCKCYEPPYHPDEIDCSGGCQKLAGWTADSVCATWAGSDVTECVRRCNGIREAWAQPNIATFMASQIMGCTTISSSCSDTKTCVQAITDQQKVACN